MAAEGALAEFDVAAGSVVEPARAAQVHAAIADFDFDLALQQLDAVLGAIDDMAQEITE